MRQKMQQVVVQAPEAAGAPVQPAAEPEALAKAREAQRAVQVPAEGSQQPREALVPVAPRTASKKPRVGSLNFPPLEGPPIPISAEKDRRLQELLQRYKADQITPEQYHEARAKILSEP